MMNSLQNYLNKFDVWSLRDTTYHRRLKLSSHEYHRQSYLTMDLPTWFKNVTLLTLLGLDTLHNLRCLRILRQRHYGHITRPRRSLVTITITIRTMLNRTTACFMTSRRFKSNTKIWVTSYEQAQRFRVSDSNEDIIINLAVQSW
jgi:hypothetical protein